MPTTTLLLRFAILLPLSLASFASAADWPQFRGPNCSGRSEAEAKLPVELGPGTNVIWKTAFAPGHSSPAVVDGVLYVTGVRGSKLLTIAVNRQDGQIIWEQEAPSTRLEKVHQIGSHAQASPAADGERVVS